MKLEKVLSIRLPEALYIQLVDIADLELTSTSSVARRCIQKEIERIKKDKKSE